jgi:hypothetical protein
MTVEYSSGAEVLSEARLRRAGLGDDSGVLIVEGRDDLRLLKDVCRSSAHVLPAGKKQRVLEAAEYLRPSEDKEFVLLVDCDYDVPAGDLRGSSNLVITQYSDAESDMFALGVLEKVVFQAVPFAASSDEDLKETTERVRARAIALADAVGKFRRISRLENLGLDFKDLRFSKARTKGSASVDTEKLARMLSQRSQDALSPSQLMNLYEQADEVPMSCNGHDLVESVRVILHEDFGINQAELRGLDTLMRTCASEPQFIARWSVLHRIRAWEASSGRGVLTPSN